MATGRSRVFPRRTRDDGRLDADRAAVLLKLEEALHVVEELRDHQIRARVHLRTHAPPAISYAHFSSLAIFYNIKLAKPDITPESPPASICASMRPPSRNSKLSFLDTCTTLS